jgi:hypothetical protein
MGLVSRCVLPLPGLGFPHPTGTNGAYITTTHWDEVSGWGSTNLYNLARDLAAL